jgi:hypothetical protein
MNKMILEKYCKSIGLVISIIVLMTLLVSCGAQTDSGTGAANEVTYRVGYPQLTIEQIPNMPPKKLYESQTFEIGFRICNNGVFDASNGFVSLSGFDSTYISTDISSLEFPSFGSVLEGKNALNPGGSCTNLLTFPAQVIYVEDGVAEYKAPYYLNIQSSQLFELSQTVCVGGTTAYLVKDGGCDLDAPITLNGQGASLGVSRIDTIAQGDKIIFGVQLKNGGSGSVEGATIVRAQLGGEPLECVFKKTKTKTYSADNDKNKRDGAQGVPSIFCEAAMSADMPTYPTTLFLQVFYDYDQFEINELLIEGSGINNNNNNNLFS